MIIKMKIGASVRRACTRVRISCARLIILCARDSKSWERVKIFHLHVPL